MAATWAPWPRTTPPSSWTIVPPPWTPTPQFTSPLKSDSDIHVCQMGLFLYFDLSSGFGLFYIIFKLTKPRKVFALSTRTHRHTQPLHTSGYSLWVFFIWVFVLFILGGGWILLVCSFWVVFSFEGVLFFLDLAIRQRDLFEGWRKEQTLFGQMYWRAIMHRFVSVFF